MEQAINTHPVDMSSSTFREITSSRMKVPTIPVEHRWSVSYAVHVRLLKLS